MQKFWVPLVLFAAALVLFLNPWPFVSPLAAFSPAPGWATDPTPVRQPTLRPEYVVAGFTYRCSDCHRVIVSPAETYRPLFQHTEILLNHGINTRCFNCHHLTNRDAFADDSGNPIPWDQPQLLCAKCHGPVYRDWQHGAHGRLNGFWDKTRGPQTRRRCIECHDPHTPPFPPMTPAPGPHTLRMHPGIPTDPSRHAAETHPLRIHPVAPGGKEKY